MKKLMSSLKPYLRWLILGLTAFFLVHTLKTNWQEIAEIQITSSGWLCLALAFLVTITAHFWSGWVWLLILREFKQTIKQRSGLQIYLKTNIAKYLPGNIWHFYGRITAVNKAGVSLGPATLSVLLEPLLMASAALLIALITAQQKYWGLQILCLLVVLTGVHPRILNPIVNHLRKIKWKVSSSENTSEFCYQLERYPLRPLLGEMGFVGLRGIGFLLTALALMPFTPQQIPLLVSAYSLAWLLGLIIPGAPGGLGVFEATTLTLLDSHFSAGLLLTAVACYRVVSVLAETFGALFAGIDQHLVESHKPII
ncbi:MAG: lysylphosphatidylglycerol synthase domain-containing protein [Limnoraphis robusta]|uniref:Integral membrane protein n=1 Tax=Limnoraphis robusta CS-951 TaxID=1637645 RepID=A0A0J9EXB2_9CYAN|nr:lysylphosphatidylglycerol synthase domain-containing protein [Limnoraphis robusta]KMW70776.1 integral membrane protein [Limnoraphis robusta CS-951]MEA5497460.1 lysylphosphatidylglycerol synthase domain-containing protein [Limnoraphis robusta BA-68 BA1]MEA5540561.1 lysylphosphatidylglycerol synthase domain-containing protein [Limnoraphis robusta Tam1]